MQSFKILIGTVALFLMCHASFSQNGRQPFKMFGDRPRTIELNQTFTETREIFPFPSNLPVIYGLAIKADVTLENDKSIFRAVLVDDNFNEYLIYESYELLESVRAFSVDDLCEETCLLEGVRPYSLRIEITDGTVTLKSLTISGSLPPGLNVQNAKREQKQLQHAEKIKKISRNIADRGLGWIAGPTTVSELSYSERKKLYGQGTFPPGFEYYAGGVIQAGNPSLKSATESMMVESWDWRNRHGQNWITPVTNQGSCGSCWAFAATGATEALVNVYFNQHLDLNLSEQDVLSCSGAGSCSGGFPATALNYISQTGVVDDAAFPYTATDQPCENKSTNPSEIIRIGGKIDFGYSLYPRSEDNLKKMLIERGPVSGGLYDWSHAMVLVGYQVVKEGDYFYYRDLSLSRYWKQVNAGDPLIGKTVWIFKNSWGTGFGDKGYVYVETDISNMGWTHALLTPVQSMVQNYSVVYADNDGDGYYWWGLGPKPLGCGGPDEPDGDDSNPELGPLDEYGNCTIIGGPPVASFSVTDNSITEGESVTFTDMSSNNPTSWSWTFEGGTPETSTLRNPVITYNTPGSFNVSLVVENSNGSDALTIVDYIAVEEYIPAYCETGGDASSEWIARVQLGDLVHNTGSSGTRGYEDFTHVTFNLEQGQSYSLALEPGFVRGSKFEYWAVWIDFNGDYDFDDAGERVFTDLKNRSTAYGTITIPEGITTGNTRMRIAMCRSEILTPCGNISYGEVEDYSVSINEPVPQPLTADFTASPVTVVAGGTVSFADLSTGNPTSWQWTFEGGEPYSDNSQNPVVTYNTPGTYDVNLVVSNSDGSHTALKQDFITVTEYIVSQYCSPVNINSSSDWISKVEIGTSLINHSSGDSYSLFPETVTLTPGQNYKVRLAPFNAGNRNFWKLWIDFNGDGDFNDSDETLFTGNNKKGEFESVISIPAYASGVTRMRVTMCTGSSPGSCDDNFNGEVEDYFISFGSSIKFLKNAEAGTSLTDKRVDYKIYPNPTGGTLNLHVSESAKGNHYTIHSAMGQLILSEKISSIHTPVDVSGFVSGIYHISIVDKGNVWNEKFIKK